MCVVVNVVDRSGWKVVTPGLLIDLHLCVLITCVMHRAEAEQRAARAGQEAEQQGKKWRAEAEAAAAAKEEKRRFVNGVLLLGIICMEIVPGTKGWCCCVVLGVDVKVPGAGTHGGADDGSRVCCTNQFMYVHMVCRVELELQSLQQDLDQECRKRQQLEEQLRQAQQQQQQQQRHHGSSREYSIHIYIHTLSPRLVDSFRPHAYTSISS